MSDRINTNPFDVTFLHGTDRIVFHDCILLNEYLEHAEDCIYDDKSNMIGISPHTERIIMSGKKTFFITVIVFLVAWFVINGILLAATGRTGAQWIEALIQSMRS